jgi:hypothetical protein
LRERKRRKQRRAGDAGDGIFGDHGCSPSFTETQCWKNTAPQQLFHPSCAERAA